MSRYQFTNEQRALLEGLSQPFAVYQFIDKKVATLVLSDGFCELFGYEDRTQAYYDMDNDMYKDTHPDDVARIADAAFRFATEGGVYEVIYRTRVKGSSDFRIVHAMGKHVQTETGARLAHVWYTDEGAYMGERTIQSGNRLNSVLNQALHEESLLRASYYDFLTGLPNMVYFFDLGDVAKKTIVERDDVPVMLFMDLNGMKFFNAQNGLAEGDKLLREFAKLLKNTFSNECCCRVGADHFAAFTVEKGLEERLEKFLRDCCRINEGNNLPVRIGIYPNSVEDVHVSMALDRARFACESMRSTYKSCYTYYDHNLRNSEERRRYVLSNLDRAIDEKWIHVYYQPIIRAVNERVCDEEALSRWIDPELGILSPIDFIPALEEAGTIYKLDLYVLDQVLEKMRSQREAGLEVVPHSINLSRSDFTECDIVEETCKRVDDAGIERNMISIEVTESTVGSDIEFMKTQVERFRELGFPVWMDDFGSGYSSLNLLQSIEFDLIKFDMSFMRRLDEGESGKVVLTELMKMVTALGVNTLCEGVETELQKKFLQEIGCSKLQGFYFCKAISPEEIIKRYEEGRQIGFEDLRESDYYDAIGSVNLYDLAVITSEEDDAFKNYFDTLPMGVMEIDGDKVEFVRTNQSYRDFMQRFFGLNLEDESSGYTATPFGLGSAFMKLVRTCCDEGGRAFFDETMPDGSIVHSFARRIGVNPVSGKKAAVIAVLSVTERSEGATYASIARALATDYLNIYYVDLDTERFIEYSSPIGGQELAMERHGEQFFESSRNDSLTRIYDEDREQFLASFSRENVLKELDSQGVYTATYRLIDSGEPVYAHMKATRLQPGANQLIVGVSIVDSQMKHQESYEELKREQDVLRRVMALSSNYLSVYSVDPETGRYYEYNVAEEFSRLGFAKEGKDIYEQAIIDAKQIIHPDDLPGFLQWFTKENIRKQVDEHGATAYHYRLMMPEGLKNVSFRVAKVKESSGEKFIAGIRAWRERRSEREDETD